MNKKKKKLSSRVLGVWLLLLGNSRDARLLLVAFLGFGEKNVSRFRFHIHRERLSLVGCGKGTYG
jgi:hypothetical protein